MYERGEMGVLCMGGEGEAHEPIRDLEYLHRADTADGDVVPVPTDRQVPRSALVLGNSYLDRNLKICSS